MSMHRLFLAALFTLIPLNSILALEPLRIAGLQLEIREEIYASEERFLCYADTEIARLLKEEGADLLVIPEYTGVFFAAFGLPRSVLTAESLDEAGNIIMRATGTADFEEFLIRSDVAASMDRIWGGLARKHGVAIVAGSYFAVESGEKGDELRNRTVVYGPDGELLYTQDKVFLTPFERDLIGIDPGSLAAARPFEYRGYRIALTICRDTFFKVWEDRFGKADFWIDIKANGEEFGQYQAGLFERALPARIAESPVPAGMTVCLTGEFLDLFWEGYSSVVVEEEGGFRYLDRATTARGRDTVRYLLRSLE